MSKIYPIYAFRRFGFKEGLRRSIHHFRFMFTYEIPHRIKDFRERDRRKKLGWGTTKWAINRDGDLFLVECPQCHKQNIWFEKETRKFECSKCKIIFSVYLEDGVVKLVDYREGNIQYFPRTAYRDLDNFYRLGIEGDAPWWWRSKAVYRDLHDGMDAHNHESYKIVSKIEKSSPQTVEMARNGQ